MRTEQITGKVRGQRATETEQATEPVRSPQRWWYCKSCLAVNDGLDSATCWNCNRVQRKTKDFPWCEMGKRNCKVCKKSYVVWILPAGTVLSDEPYELGLCRNYFEHHGDDAYFPPMLPIELMLEGNNWRYDERTKKVVTRYRKRVT